MFKNLENVLNRAGLTQQDLAYALGVGRGTLENKLKGISKFNVDEIDIIVNMFNEYQYRYLFAREPERNQEVSQKDSA